MPRQLFPLIAAFFLAVFAGWLVTATITAYNAALIEAGR